HADAAGGGDGLGQPEPPGLGRTVARQGDDGAGDERDADGDVEQEDRRPPANSVSAPPTTTPQPAPSPPIAPHRASARARSRPGAKAVAIRASADAAVSAAPKPWAARPASSIAGGAARPQIAEATVNTPVPYTNGRRPPGP